MNWERHEPRQRVEMLRSAGFVFERLGTGELPSCISAAEERMSIIMAVGILTTVEAIIPMCTTTTF